jgi:hypothetical protein
MSMPNSLASFCRSRFHSRTREPLLPPPSAVRAAPLEPGGRTHHHLRRDPATEIGADQHTVLKAQLAGEVEIQVGHVVDAARTVVDQQMPSPTRPAPACASCR